MTFDCCVIGHITRDRIERAGTPARVQPGGTAYYAGLTAARLGLRTAVRSKMRRRDRAALLAELQAAGVDLRVHDTPQTTAFVNAYPDGSFDARTQQVLALAAPFHPDEVDVQAGAYLFGPLTHGEVPAACLAAVAGRGGLVALDLQGLLRHVHGARVVLVPDEAALRLLRHVDILKAGRREAALLTGAATVAGAARALAAAGPREVLVTSGGAGSHVLAGDRLTPIPAYAPPAVVGTTGCGDTYLAAYLVHRLHGHPPAEAGHFASRVAGAKTAYHGAFRGDLDAVCPVRDAPD